MTNIEWLLEKVPAPTDSADFEHLYDELCEFKETHMSLESYKRLCRKAVQRYRENIPISPNTQQDFNPTSDNLLDTVDVRLDRLNETENKLELALRSYKIQDVETAAEIAGIDLSRWKCTNKNVRASQNAQNPWFIVEGKFKRKEDNERDVQDYVKEFQELIANHTPPTEIITPRNHKQTSNIAVFSFYDHHIGKRVQGDTTGNFVEWTTEKACQTMIEATDYFIENVKDKVGKVWFVLGNDVLNFDNNMGETTRGTRQFNDIDYRHLFHTSNELLITILEKLLHHFEVDVIVVPGNHDTNTCYFLGEVVSKYFENNPHINVDNGFSDMKFAEFGENAFLFCHGSEMIRKKYVLPMVMLQRKPEYAHKKFKECHTGHLHQNKTTLMTEVSEDYGTTIRVLPSLSPTCQWASGKGYQGQQSSKCMVYNKDKGNIITYNYNI